MTETLKQRMVSGQPALGCWLTLVSPMAAEILAEVGYVAIKRTLDLGVAGIMVPSVNSVEEARAAVAACRYPPEGIRGNAAGIVRASNYGMDAADYQKRINDELLVILQIESREAVEATAEIARVPGVDMLFLGPSDLAGSLGRTGDPGHPDVAAAVARYEAAGKAEGVMLGSILQRGRDAVSLARDGYQLVLADSDAGILRNCGLESVKRFGEAFK